jgi:hypothetical protein
MPAIPLRTLIEHPEILESWMKPELCPKCKRPLQLSSGDELMEILERGYCDDCYYEMMGEEIEKHPICSPRVRRG